jgi:hypothetical protein
MDGRMKPKDLLEIVRRRRDEAETADRLNREECADDLKVLVGRQWDEEVRKAREAEGKPCLTINGMSQFVRQVTGQIRELNPSIRVMAADGNAQQEVAEIYEGLIRQIEYHSEADAIYERAAETAAACGIGHWRLRTQYCEGDTFDQEIILEPVHNPFAVLWDPLAKHPTRKDARYCFVLETMEREDFKEQYPKAVAEPLGEDQHPSFIHHWHTGDLVSVAEYFWIEEREHTIGLTADGQVVRDPVAPLNIVRKRKVTEPVVMWAKVTGYDILEGPQEVVGPFIPVVSVTGEEWHLGEEMVRSSVIRFAKDPQKLYNYARSAQAELIALQPKAPYLVTARQIKGYEAFWEKANQSNTPVLPYNADPEAPPPQRVQPPIPSSALMGEIQLASEDMKRTTGIYDASLGARSNETSGVAIQSRQAEAQNSTSIYADNMVRAVRHTGRMLVAMIPKVYDTQRVIRILGEDDQEKMVAINAVMNSANGPVPVNDLTVGKYDVRIGVGPTYATKRQEATDGMMQFLQAVPAAAAVTGDIVASMQDWPEADRIAERLRKTLPPGLVDDEEQGDEGMALQQAVQAQLAQIVPQIQQQAMQEAAQAPEAVEARAKAAKAEADAAKAQAEAQLKQMELAQMTGQLDAAINARIGQEVARALQGGAAVPQGMV